MIIENKIWPALQPEFPESDALDGKLSVASRNRLSVLRLLINNPGISQRRLAKVLRLQASTLSNICNELRDAGLLGEGEVIVSNKVGPPEKALRLLPDSAWACGIEIDTRGCNFSLVNGEGSVIGKHRLPASVSFFDLVDRIPLEVEKLRRESRVEGNLNGGVCLSLPAIVNYHTGEVVWSKKFDLHKYPLQKIIADKCPYPVWVDRNVTYGAYHESIAAEGRQWESFAYFMARKPTGRKRRPTDYSLGMSFVVGNRFYRGFNHASGELDHSIFPDLANEMGRSDNNEDLKPAFLKYCARHLASVINLLDVGKLIVAADLDLLNQDDFPFFEKHLREHLLPVPERWFTVRYSRIGTTEISTGAALFGLHRSLERRLLSHLGLLRTPCLTVN